MVAVMVVGAVVARCLLLADVNSCNRDLETCLGPVPLSSLHKLFGTGANNPKSGIDHDIGVIDHPMATPINSVIYSKMD